MDDKLLHLIMQFLPFIFVLVFVFFFVFVVNKSKAEKLKTLAREFSGKVSIFPFVALRGRYNSINFKVSLIPASRHSPPYLYFYFYRKPSFSLTIRKESAAMRIGEKFGFIHNIKTRDPDFDKEFVAISSNKGTVLSLLTRREVKQAIRDIFAEGFTVIKAKREFFISKPNYQLKQDVTSDKIRYLLERMFIIARGY